MAQQAGSRVTREAQAGVFLAVAGGIILLLTWPYPSGTPSDIGPGFVLQAAGALVAVLGLLMLVRGLRRGVATGDEEGGVASMRWRPFIVLAAMTGFGLLLPWLGLAVTGFLATWLVSYGSSSLSWRERLLAALVLSAFVTALFGYGLNLQVKIWP